MKSLRLVLALCLAVAATAQAGAKKQNAVTIRFYGEGGPEGGTFSEKITTNAGHVTNMASMPLFTEREVLSYHPFAAKDGTMGAYFRLDDHGMRLLEQHTMSRRGSYIIVFFNGKHIVDLLVNKAVHDGIAVIPSGLTQHDIDLLEITFPPFGKEGEKPVKKKLAPQPTPGG
jgi:hypothetical protein